MATTFDDRPIEESATDNHFPIRLPLPYKPTRCCP